MISAPMGEIAGDRLPGVATFGHVVTVLRLAEHVARVVVDDADARYLGEGCGLAPLGEAVVFDDAEAAEAFLRRHACDPSFVAVEAGTRAA
jgi:hypothetical protein